MLSRLSLNRKIILFEWELDAAVLAILLLGIVIGVIFALHGGVLKVAAEAAATFSFDTDTDLNQAALTNTQVQGTGSGAYVQITQPTAFGDAWYDVNWAYRKKLNFNNSVNAENLVNFPVLVKLTSSNFDFAKAKTDGADIRFTDSDGTTLLSYQIESWSTPGQEAYLWVKVPQINSASNADYIYIYYGNAGASSGASAANVWTANYVGVWQSNEPLTAATVSDSTSNALNGTKQANMTAADAIATGIVDGGFNYDGTTTDFITLGQPAALTVSPNSSDFTIEAWIRMNINAAGTIFSKGNATAATIQYELYVGSNILQGRVGGTNFSSAYVVADGDWHHVVLRNYNNAGTRRFQLYVDGVQRSTQGTSGAGVATGFDVLIGARRGSTNTAVTSLFSGDMGYVRFSNVARSPIWIAATYASENNTYLVYSAEQTRLTTGTWESNAGAIDLIWNGGWGDGTVGSTAVTINTANTSASANVVLQMRVAADSPSLSSASYVTLATINSGTTTTLTKEQMEGMAFATGTSGRHVQLKATFTSVNGTTNPQLGSIAISYLKDNTPPGGPSSISMLKAAGGATVGLDAWTNGESPAFSWTAGSDTQAGIKGYCLYLGLDSAGNPATSSGLLGTSPVATTGTTCGFIVATNSIDFANASYKGNPWVTSSNQTYYFFAKTVDTANNISTTAAAEYRFKFDNTAPTNPAFISLPAGFVATKDVTITWPTAGGDMATDANSGLAGLQYRIGSGTWYGDLHNGNQDLTDLVNNDGSYRTDATVDYPLLVEGNNVISFRALDNAGNVTSTYVTGALKINTVAPSNPENLSVSPSSSTSNSFSFNWQQPQAFAGSAANLNYCYTVNTLPNANTCIFTGPGVTSLAANSYASQPGTNTIYVVAKDEANNINYETYTTITFTYSGTAPGAPNNMEIADISVKTTSTWKLALTWTQPTSVGGGVASYRIYRSLTNTTCGANFNAFSQIGSTSGESYVDTGLNQQTYYYCAKACDNANNCGAPSATVSMYPDGRYTTPPTILAGPTSSNISTRKATISWTTDRNGDTKVAYGLISGSYFAEEPSIAAQTTDHSISLLNLQPGATYYYVSKWTDEDGNTGQSTERTFTTLPAPTISNVVVSNIGLDSAVIRFTAANAQKVNIYYGKSAGFGGLLETGTGMITSSYTQIISSLDDNTKYFYKLNPVDADGNEYQGTTLDFTTLPRPKLSGIEIEEVKGTAQPTVRVRWQSNTAVTSVVTYYPENNPAASLDEVKIELISGKHEMIVRALLPKTTYVMKVSGRDKFGNEAASDLHRFTTATDTRPPLVSNIKTDGAILTSGEEPMAQLIISWDTDEPGTSQVEFGEGSAGVYAQKTLEDPNLSVNHLVVISNLSPSKVYHLRIVTKDETGNTGVSSDIVKITPRASVDALDLVVGNLSDIFSFLRN